jgi:hypothetical protein
VVGGVEQALRVRRTSVLEASPSESVTRSCGWIDFQSHDSTARRTRSQSSARRGMSRPRKISMNSSPP